MLTRLRAITAFVYRAREVPAEAQAEWDPAYVGYESIVAADLLVGLKEPKTGE